MYFSVIVDDKTKIHRNTNLTLGHTMCKSWN